MRRINWPATAVFMLAVSFSSSASGQQPTASPSPAEDQQTSAELQGKAISLLDEIAREAQTLRLAENRILIRATVAGLLWPHDEARARVLFREAVGGFREMGEVVDDPTGSGMRVWRQREALRHDVLLLLAQHDPRWAREQAQATRALFVAAGDAGAGSNDADLEVEFATAMAATDPKQALAAGEETLSQGFSNELIELLTTLGKNDQEAAQKLGRDIVAKLHSANLSADDRANSFAASLLKAATTPAAGSKNDAPHSAGILDQQSLRELAEMLAAAALSADANSFAVWQLRELAPAITEYAPARAAGLRKKMGDLGTAPDVMSPGMEQYRSLVESGNADALLDAALNAPPAARERLTQLAIEKLAAQGDVDRARQVINERITEPSQRRVMLAEVETTALANAAAQGKIEQAHKIVAGLRTTEDRVIALTTIATAAQAKGDRAVALQLLDEARAMVGARPKTFTQMASQLMVAHGYSNLLPARSFAIIEPLIDQLNELIAAGTVLGGFIAGDELIRDDEIVLASTSGMIGPFTKEYGGDVRALVGADFNRLKADADRFQRVESRILAQLMIAGSILAPTENKTAAPRASAFGR